MRKGGFPKPMAPYKETERRKGGVDDIEMDAMSEKVSVIVQMAVFTCCRCLRRKQ